MKGKCIWSSLSQLTSEMSEVYLWEKLLTQAAGQGTNQLGGFSVQTASAPTSGFLGAS